jgi:hypothetical protein
MKPQMYVVQINEIITKVRHQFQATVTAHHTHKTGTVTVTKLPLNLAEAVQGGSQNFRY